MVTIKPLFLKPFLLTLFVLVVVFAFSLNAQSQEIPDDFEVVFTSSPAVVEEEIDTETLTIKADGTVVASAKARYTGQIPDITREDLPEMQFSLGPEALSNIFAAINDNDFFGLQASYNNPNILDGDWAELTVTAGGRTHTVRTRNIKVNAFDRITITINGTLPEHEQLKYNAINGADYKEIER